RTKSRKKSDARSSDDPIDYSVLLWYKPSPFGIGKLADLRRSVPAFPFPTLPAGTGTVMDDPKVPTEADPFVPLRLTLYPGGSSVNLTRPDMLIGRHSEADLRLHLPDVSRRHCRFIFRDGGWHVYDLHSMNGLFVNEERVEQAALHDGDLV